MAFSMSGGQYSYNRFDEYQQLIEKQSKKDREDEHLGEKDGKESSKKQSEKDRRDEEEGEKKSEKKKGKFWQDSDGDGKWYEKGEDVAEEKVRQADKYSEKKMEKGLDKGADMKKEDVMMSSYVDALSRLSGMYHPWDNSRDHAPEMQSEEKVRQAKKMTEKDLEKGLDKGADTKKEAFMAGYEAALNEKKETTAERKSAADRGFEKKRQEKEGKYGEAHETGEIMKLQDKKLSEASGAGSPGKMAASVKKEAESNKKETDAMAFASKKQRRQQAVNAAEQFVMESLIEDGLANNMVSAETIMLHMSDEWFDSIIAEMGPAFPSETKAQAKAQSDHREGKSAKGEKTGKNPGPKMSHTSGYNRQD